MEQQPECRPEPPAGWPRATRPIRVAMLGWARLSMQAREGSGYNLSASELASGLVLSGHAVSYLASGSRYSFRPGVFIRRRAPWRGVDCYDLYNSPNVSPAAANFRNMSRERSCPKLARVVVRWLERVGAELVHIHSLEGLSLDVVGAIRASGRPVVVTPHNYWYICPQVDLLHQELRVCMDYEGGRRCEGCLAASAAWRTRLRRRCGQSVERSAGVRFADAMRRAVSALGQQLRSPVQDPAELMRANSMRPDPELARGFDVDADDGHDGRIDHGLALAAHERPSPIERCTLDQNERFLAATHHRRVVNGYGQRRLAGVDALNRADAILCPSDFLRQVYARLGVDPSRLRTLRLGQPHLDQLNRRARRSPYYGLRPWDARTSRRPVRFGFLGTTRNNKGLEILVQAIPLLAPAIRKRCVFHIRAAGWDWPFRKRLSSYPEVSYLGAYDTLQLLGAAGEYDVGILPHVWFENSPLVMLEHLHAGKFVIASRLGGPVEWIVEPGQDAAHPLGNGLLFPGGDAAALAACIERIVRGEVALPSAAEVHAATPLLCSYLQHVSSVMGVYAELLGLAPAGRHDTAGQPDAPAVGCEIRVPDRSAARAAR